MAKAAVQPVLQDCHVRHSHHALQILQQGAYAVVTVEVLIINK